MFKVLILQLLALVSLCSAKDIIIGFLAGLAADTETQVDDLGVMAADVVLSNVLGCESPINSLSPEAKSAVMESIRNNELKFKKTK